MAGDGIDTAPRPMAYWRPMASAPAPPSSPAALGVRGRPLMHRGTSEVSIALLQPTLPEHEIRPHQHDEMHVVVLLSGRYVSDAAGMPEVCGEPAVVFNPPGTEHRDRFRSRDGRFLTVTMPAAAYARLGDGIRPAACATRLPAAALGGAARLLRELAEWDDASALAVEGALAGWIAAAGAPATVPGDPRLQRVRECLDDAASRAPSLKELAAIAGFHPVYLARAFRKRYGIAPGDYLRMRRAHRAMSLLAARRTPAEIAASLGFVDASHLHRAFVAEFGMTPGTFRRLALGRAEVARIQDRRLRRC